MAVERQEDLDVTLDAAALGFDAHSATAEFPREAVSDGVHVACAHPGALVGGAYRLVAQVGVGGGGEVWRAVCLAHGISVAVKLLSPALSADPRQVQRFRREFRVLSRLSHASCVKVLAEGEYGAIEGARGRRFLVTEWVGGGTLERYVGASHDVLLPLLIQVASALDYIHRRHIVHRDLKPANVLLSTESPPVAKLADFGISALQAVEGDLEATAPVLTGVGTLLGTIDYFSPEQVLGLPADPRSDLYAFGVMMFVLWAGEAPFGGAPIERLWARTTRKARPLPHAPAPLAALVADLLETKPEARVASAYELAHRLMALAPSASESGKRRMIGALPRTSESTPGVYLYPAGLVGRDAECERLSGYARRVYSGTSAAIAIVGSAGLGKTALADAFTRALARDGWRIERLTVPHYAEAFGPMSPLIDRFRHATPSSDNARGAGESKPAGKHQRSGGRVRRAQIELAERLASVLPRGPVCVVLDDLHEASANAVGALALTIKQAAAEKQRLLVIATSRPEGRDVLQGVGGFDVLSLSPLEDVAASQLVARILGTGDDETPFTISRPLLAEANGNPLLLRTAIHNLARDGALRRDPDGWHLEAGGAPSQAVTALLDSRLEVLTPPARRVVEVAALMGDQFDPDILLDAIGGDEVVVYDALAEATAAAVLVPVSKPCGAPEDCRFEHGRLAERLVEMLRPEQVAGLHDRIAVALERANFGIAAVARHAGRGTDPARAVRVLRAAAKDASRRGDAGTAARLLELAVQRHRETGAPSAEHHRLRERHADALARSGDHAAAVAEYQVLESLTEGALDRARVARKHGQSALATPSPDRGISALQHALEYLGDQTPRTRFGRFVRLSWDAFVTFTCWWIPRRPCPKATERATIHRELAVLYRWIDLYDSGGHLMRFFRLSRRSQHPAHPLDAYTLTAMMAALRSKPRVGAFLQKRASRIAEGSGDKAGLARLTAIRGAAHGLLHDDPQGLALLDRSVTLAEESGDQSILCFAVSSRAWLRGIFGGVERACEEFQQAEALAASIHNDWLRTDACCGRALATLALGNTDLAEELAKDVLASPLRFSFPVFEHIATEILAGVAFVRGDFASALEGYERAYALLKRHRLSVGWGFLTPMEIIEAACCLADDIGGENVPRFIPRLEAATRGMIRMSRGPLHAGCVDIAKGVIASRKGDRAMAEKHFQRGVDARANTRASYMDTWVLVRPALERRRWGDSSAEATLDEVDRRYAECGMEGMRHWLRTIRAALRM